MNGNLKNIISYIKEVIELRNKNIYDINDFLLSFDYDEFCNKYSDIIEKKHDLSVLTNGVFLKIKYISDKDKKRIPIIPQELKGYIEIDYEELNGINDNFEQQLKDNDLFDKYLGYKSEFLKVKQFNKRIDDYNDLYMKIYTYYKKITDYEEKIEFILGTDLMFWKSNNGEVIKRHIIEASLNINVDPFTNTITFSINDEIKKGFVSDFLNKKSYTIKDNAVLYETIERFNNKIQTGEDVIIKDSINKYINSISYENEIIDDSIQNYKTTGLTNNVTYVFNNRHIIVRNKNAKLWVEDLKSILETCNKEKINSPILNLLDVDFDNSDEVEKLLNAIEVLTDDEVLFPLATNDEQFKIVDRVRTSNLVLVQGPPGTGKSHTIANLISHFISEGKKVIVTSEKAKALEVIREKLPPEIRCLSLALLSSKGLDKDLEFSIEKVLKKQEESENLEYMENQIKALNKELKQIRQEKINNRNEIIKLMNLDTVSHEQVLKDLISGEVSEYNLVSIAKWLTSNKQYDLIPLSDTENIEYNNLIGLFESLNGIVDIIQKEKYSIAKRVDEKEYLNDNSLLQLIIEVNKNDNYEIQNNELKESIIFEKLNENLIISICDLVEELNDINEAFTKTWVLENIKYKLFIDNLIQIKKDIKNFEKDIYTVEQNNINYSINYNISKIDNYMNSLKNIIESIGDKKELSFFNKVKCSSDIKLLNEISINSLNNNTNILEIDVLNVILNKLNYDKAVRSIKERLQKLFHKDIFELLNISSEEFGKSVQKLNDLFDSFINYSEKVSKIDEALSDVINTKIYEISFENIEYNKLKSVLSDLKYYATKDAYLNRIERIDDDILNDYRNDNLIYLNGLVASIRNCDLEKTKEYKEKLKNEIEIINKYCNIKDTYLRFFNEKSHFMYNYVYEYDNEKRNFVINNINNILKYNFVNHYYNLNENKTKILPELFDKKEELQLLEKSKVIQLIELKGWYNQVKNMTPKITTSLGKWLDLKRKYGKGTGKNANMFLHEMQKEMSVSKNAIPVWIMPVDKLIEQYPFSNDPQFDVLIMDESSQTSLLSISALTRGKKVIIVGDDKQISPISVGQSIEEINDLRVKYLQNNEWSYILDGNTSIYDIVQTVCNSKKIVLTEHFRCLPEIINYSRYQFYNGEINPLKVRSVENTIKKPIMTVHVPGATCKRIGTNPYNIKEIERIIQLISDMDNDSQYKDKSIGIIVLQNSSRQIQKISELIMQTFGEKFIRERNIKVGDSYDFQGDERDVIILSMVISSTDENGDTYRLNSLTKKEFDRSFNVAASRAKEQMVLVHSVKLEELNPSCNRFKLLNYCETYDKEKQKSIEELFESGFEKDIYHSLKAKNINLVPQYKVGKYRIDFIVENPNGLKIALECDGDKYHSIEQLNSDIERQTVLERCGWKFVRVRASEYYYEREKTINRIVEDINQYFSNTLLIQDNDNIEQLEVIDYY